MRKNGHHKSNLDSVNTVQKRVIGPFKKYVTRLRGRGLAKKMTNCDKGGRGIGQLFHKFHPYFDVVVHVENVNCVENMHISRNM